MKLFNVLFGPLQWPGASAHNKYIGRAAVMIAGNKLLRQFVSAALCLPTFSHKQGKNIEIVKILCWFEIPALGKEGTLRPVMFLSSFIR